MAQSREREFDTCAGWVEARSKVCTRPIEPVGDRCVHNKWKVASVVLCVCRSLAPVNAHRNAPHEAFARLHCGPAVAVAVSDVAGRVR